MKRILTENSDIRAKEKEEHARNLAQTFRTAPFSELQTMTQAKVKVTLNKSSNFTYK